MDCLSKNVGVALIYQDAAANPALQALSKTKNPLWDTLPKAGFLRRPRAPANTRRNTATASSGSIEFYWRDKPADAGWTSLDADDPAPLLQADSSSSSGRFIVFIDRFLRAGPGQIY